MPSKRRRGRGGRRRKSPTRTLLLAVLAAALITGAFLGLYRCEQSRYHENRGETSADFYADTKIEVDGVEYKTRHELTPVLLEGVSGSRQKVEMLALCLLDHERQTIRWLQMDPDTALPSGGVLRDALPSVGDEKERANAVMETVGDLLDVPVELYVSLDLERIGVLNRTLGGISLTLSGDYSAYDPAMTAGAALTLSDAQAELYMNPSIVLPGDDCPARMQRQREFMFAALEALKREAKKDTEILNRLYDELDGVMVTNVRPARMLSEAAKAHGYAIAQPELLPGTESVSDNGEKRFEPDAAQIRSWVLEAFYRQEQ